ncbi:POTRA domain-containing protein [Hydrogenophaga taeniospiralis]|uniref:POTRA domain-containing protein n=1 Tax=Hydrogenophaga taeniospiralis TaxID=65656 RepID=UPI001CFA9D81|nr:POTRA domain-containing protein [Hydrogenophaga taeniospiralis]UCU92260.1 ShlB/FhaC/HecB family hemolysin secretion/activation protein [Hydrogenophaga taeniospiralis]
MNTPNPTRMLAGAILLCPLAVAVAQTLPPDPAAVMNEHIRRMENTAPGNKAPIPTEPATPANVAPTTTGTVNLKEIQFSASVLLEADVLRELGARYVGRALRSADLQALLNDISALYRQKGVLTAQPVLPQQNLGSGVLKVLLVEGRLGQVKVRTPGYADPKWAAQWFDLARGEVVTNDALQSRLGRFNASSDMLASAEFVPGERFGLTDLAIDVQENPRAQFWSFVETQTAGSDLMAAGVRVAPVGQTGGKFEAAALATADAKTLLLAEFWPIGVQGWRAGVSGSVSQSSTNVQSETEGPDLVVKGDSNLLNFEVGRNWVLSTPWSLGTSVNWETLRSRTTVLDEQLLDQKLNRLSLSSTFNYATSGTQATVRFGLTSSNGEGNSFQHLDLTTQLQTALDTLGHWHGRINGFARLATQGDAIASEQLILGGTDTVRGFDAGSAAGEKGAALQLELRYRPKPADTQSSEGFVFVDAGQTSGGGSSQEIASFGAGLQARITPNLGADLVWSRQFQSAQASPNRWQLRLLGTW